MSTFESRAIDNTPSAVEHHSAIATMLNTDIEIFTTFKDTLEPTPIKAVFESITVILTLVRVSILAVFLFLHSPIGGVARTR